MVFYYLGPEHVSMLTRREPAMVIFEPLLTYWFYPLAVQSKLRFRIMIANGISVSRVRSINDAGSLNRGDRKENKFKTEGRNLHNAKMEFIIIINEPTRMNLKVAFVYSRTSDSGYLCGKSFPWTQGHCDSEPNSQVELGVNFEGFRVVNCKSCTKNFTECDLHFLVKSTAVLMAAVGLLHAKESSKMVVS